MSGVRSASPSRQARRALAVSALVIAITAIAIVMTRSDGATYEVRATFDDVRGLIEGGDVRAGAVPVGKVTKVEIGPGERPLVTMAIDDDFRLHEGATADIRLASNVGAVNRTVELEQGDEAAPRLRDGARLRGSQTDQPVNFDEVMDSLTPTARRNIANLLSGLEAGTRGRGPDIDRTLRHSAPALGNTAALLAEVNQDGQALRTIVGDGERVVSSLASRPGDLGATADRLAGLLSATAARRAELSETIRLLGPSLAEGRRTLDAIAAATPELRRLAAAAGPAIDALGPFARLLPEATQAAGPLVEQTRLLVKRGPALIRQARPIARAALPVTTKLEQVARDALPLARVLQVYVPETVGAFQNFGATAGAYDANGHILNVASGLNPTLPDSAATSPALGPADCDRGTPSLVQPGMLRKPYIRAPGVNECQPWTDLPPGILTPLPKDPE